MLSKAFELLALRSGFPIGTPSTVISAPVTGTEPVVPIPAAEVVEDEGQRRNALARLKAKFELPLLREGAIAEAKHWGFRITPKGICEVPF